MLAPHMLAAFIARDRGFKAMQTELAKLEAKSSSRGTWRGWIEDENGAIVSFPDTDRSSSVNK